MTKPTHILTGVTIHDEWTADGPTAVLIPITVVKRVREYVPELKAMQAKGLEPYKVQEFNYEATFVATFAEIDPELMKRIVVIGDYRYDHWDRLDTVATTMEELEEFSMTTRTELDMLGVTTEHFTIAAYLRHVEVRVSSYLVRLEEFRKAPTLFEQLDQPKHRKEALV